MTRIASSSLCLALPLLAALSSTLAFADRPFIGRFALDLPGGGAGWLGVEETDGRLSSSILWRGGSVVPTQGTKIEGDKLLITRTRKSKTETATTETITATLNGDAMTLTTVTRDSTDSQTGPPLEFTGKRIPALPAKPDLSKIEFGGPLSLLNGKDLSGWRLMDNRADNGWSVVDGILQNRVVDEDGKHFGNLRTDAEFEDFNLKAEVRTRPGSNSGIYLRGIYEIQVVESFGKPLDPHNMGALYSRLTPSVAAEKPVGQWQTLDITLVDRHLTVILNGRNIIDNQPVLGCTGGAMTSDEFHPGPIYLQGDHSDIDYRNIVLRPVMK